MTYVISKKLKYPHKFTFKLSRSSFKKYLNTHKPNLLPLLARFSYSLVIFSMFALARSWRFLTNSARLLASKFTRPSIGKGKRLMGVVGLKPYIISNGQNFVVECTTLLYENSTWGKLSSHIFGFFFRIARNNVDNVQFTTLVWRIAASFQVYSTRSSKSR